MSFYDPDGKLPREKWGDDVWFNGPDGKLIPSSEYFKIHPEEAPKNYYTTEWVNGQPKSVAHPIGSVVPAQTPEQKSKDNEEFTRWTKRMADEEPGRARAWFDQYGGPAPAGWEGYWESFAPSGGGAAGDSGPTPSPIAPPQTTTPPVPGAATPANPTAPRAAARNPIYSNMTTQLSPTTMTALSGYQGQAGTASGTGGTPVLPKKKPFGGFSGLPFGRKLYGNAF